MTAIDLASALQQWFRDSEYPERRRRRRWADDPVGQVLRTYLSRSGNWKNAPRGNPRKAYQAVTQQNEPS